MEELEGYQEYMECSEEYKEHGKTNLANIYYSMAQDELKHATWMCNAHPEIKSVVDVMKLLK